jgi:hypothetical protein
LHARLRAQRAPGIPCALCFQKAGFIGKPRTHRAARMRNCIHIIARSGGTKVPNQILMKLVPLHISLNIWKSGTSNLPTGWFSINHDGETPMTKLKLMAAAAVLSAAIAGPAMAGDGYHRGPVGAAADTAAGVAGAAVGTAAAVATAPFGNSYAYDNSHDYYANQRDYGPDGYACHPGTWIKGADGQRHVCQ